MELPRRGARLLALGEQLVHAKRFFFHMEEENRFSIIWKKKIVLPGKVERFLPSDTEARSSDRNLSAKEAS